MDKPLKFKDISPEDHDKERDHLESQSEAQTGLGMWQAPGLIFSEDLKRTYGICAKCDEFQYCRQSYQNKRAYCSRFEMMLSGKDKMVECNKFSKRGQLNLNQMADLAWLINPAKKTGFV